VFARFIISTKDLCRVLLSKIEFLQINRRFSHGMQQLYQPTLSTSLASQETAVDAENADDDGGGFTSATSPTSDYKYNCHNRKVFHNHMQHNPRLLEPQFVLHLFESWTRD